MTKQNGQDFTLFLGFHDPDLGYRGRRLEMFYK